MAGLAGPALAQIGPGPAPQVPVQQSRVLPTRGQVEALPVEDPSARRPTVNVQRLPSPGACPLDQDTTPIDLKAIVFVPARGGALPAELATLLAPVAQITPGTRPLRDVCAIRDAADRALYQAGYVASVQIGAQEIADGTLQLTVVAARVVETRVTGYKGTLPGGIARRIDAIRAMDPLNRREAERLLLLANDVPGLALTLTLTLQPAGREPGDVIAVIDVNQQHALLLANYQNTGSKQLGRSLMSLRAEFYDITGLADQTYFGFSNSTDWDEVHVVQAGHSAELGGGIRLGLRGSYALSRPDIPRLDLRSRSLVSGLDLSAPLVRTLSRNGRTVDDINVYVGTGLELINQRTIIRQGGDVPFTRDRLRVLYGRIGARITGRDMFGVVRSDTDVLVELRRGLSIFNATQRGIDGSGFQPSRLDGDPEAFVVRGTFNQTIRPFARFPALAFDASVYGQWSNHALLNLEEFAIGNLTYGRGYDPGANAGDRAVAVRLSPRLRLTGGASPVQVEATGFYDGVRFWNLDRGSSENNRLLESVGGGLRVSLASRFALEVTYSKPIDRALSIDTKRPTDRVLVSLTAQLAPWRFGR